MTILRRTMKANALRFLEGVDSLPTHEFRTVVEEACLTREQSIRLRNELQCEGYIETRVAVTDKGRAAIEALKGTPA
jgi:uncharacterized protein YaaQ